MDFYASPEYLATVSEVYFQEQRTHVEDVRIGDEVLRLLVVNDKRVVTSVPFLDYHKPLRDFEICSPTRRFGYAESVERGVIELAEWESSSFEGLQAAPYVDWSKFSTYDAYQSYIKSRGRGLLREAARRRRRLSETFGELDFRMDDAQKDVFELARRWKSAQQRRTGAKEIFTNSQNVEYFNVLRERGLLKSSSLRASGRLLSVWMGFVHDGVWSGWIFAYDPDPELRKFSVGRQLLHCMLEESYRRKHREFDFSVGDEDYKLLYSTHVRLLGSIGVMPLQQRLLRLAQDAKHEARKILSLHPPSLQLARLIMRKLRNQDLFDTTN